MFTHSSSDKDIDVPMSFHEKSAWAGLLTTAFVYLPYFIHLVRLFGREAWAASSVILMFITAVFLQTLLLAIAHAVFAVRGKPESRDERDFVIEGRAFRWAYTMFVTSVWLAVGSVIFLVGTGDCRQTLVLLTQAVLFAFVLAEATKYLAKVIGYRRGH